MSIELLGRLASELKVAAEKQDWDTLGQLISQIDEITPHARFFSVNRTQLSTALDNINASISAAVERRDEIRSLVSKLRDTPI